MKITPIPAFSDNYIWIIEEDGLATLVDPGEAAAVKAYLRQHQLRLAAIIITHHHWDHTGGIAELIADQPALPVYGPAREAEQIKTITHPLKEGDRIQIPGGAFNVFEVPGHTAGHIAYYQHNQDKNSILFSGDTLFASGCGRLFEGSPEQMQASLATLKQLAENTQIYCTHEYTQANLEFAQAVEPDNRAIQARIAEVDRLRSANQASIPTPLALELEVNPFLRLDQAAVIAAAKNRAAADAVNEVNNPVAVFTAIRRWKDQF